MTFNTAAVIPDTWGQPQLETETVEVSATNFLGIPVNGTIERYGRKATEQKPITELEPIIRAVLDDPTIEAFGWKQYTPYFNDGDICEFGASGFWVRTVKDADELEDEDRWEREERLSVSRYGQHNTLGGIVWERDKYGRLQEGSYAGPDEARWQRCLDLANAIEDGSFYDVLCAAFGDPADITVTRDGITVETYEHE